MDDSDQTRDNTAGGAPGDHDRPGLPMTGLIGLALIPVVAVLAFAAFTLSRGGAPAPAPQAEATSPAAIIRYPQAAVTGTPTATSPPPSSLPSPSPGAPAGAGGGIAGGGAGGGTGGDGGTGGGGSGGGGGGGSGGGGGGSGGGSGGGGGGGGSTGQPPPPPPPPPPPGPTITSYGCGTSGGGISCTVRYQATGAVQIRWVKDGDPMTSWNDDPTVSGGCVAGEPTFVTVTVSDSNGADSEWDSVRCPGVPK